MRCPNRLPVIAWLAAAGLLVANTASPADRNALTKPMSAHSSTKSHAHTNRLALEKSPYLLQHAHNPVDWFPWGDEAFEQARRENKPIFLSVGYSTCHWCHVMERESFEDEAIGAYLREHFISIKVDREERPDVDKIYMTYVQATTGGGGWPMTVFLTPDRKPFYGGTYFPPQGKHGRPGFIDLLQRIHELWATRREEVIASAETMTEQIETHLVKAAGARPKLNPDLLREAAMAISRQLDPVHGGFRGAPKFPTPALPSFLLMHGVRHGDRKLVEHVVLTGDKMAAGGIRDQLGGGFARYSVDERWLVPHFEKMLYDNAQLLDLYLDLYLVTGEQRFADVAHDILRYVLRDMTHPDGGFYSAEDADSEGYEGKFYAWTRAELAGLLSPAEYEVAVAYFGITQQGNFEDHSHPNPLPNQNVLSIVRPKLKDAELPLLASAKEKMFAAQLQRVRPHLDDKVLASWNGLMLGPLARAAVVLHEPKYREAAEQNLAFLQAKLWDAGTRTLYHRWRDGERDTVQLLDAYAYLLNATITFYETTLDAAKLTFARELADAMMTRFYDAEHGGFWQSLPDAKDLIMRVKEDYDGAQPSGNAVAILALLKLSDITDEARYREAAEKTLNFFADRMDRQPIGTGYFLQALDYWLDEPSRVVITGEPTDERVKTLLAGAHSVYQPAKVVLSNRGPVEEFARTIKDRDKPEAYICTGKSCQPPTSEVTKLRELLRKKR
jgi:uncharacterized protein